MGNLATFHSTNKKTNTATPEMANIEITMADPHGKYVPPPDSGIKKKMTATDPVNKPQ